MELIVTGKQIIVPEEVIDAMGRPERIQYRLDLNKKRILLSADNSGSTGYDVSTGNDFISRLRKSSGSPQITL